MQGGIVGGVLLWRWAGWIQDTERNVVEWVAGEWIAETTTPDERLRISRGYPLIQGCSRPQTYTPLVGGGVCPLRGAVVRVEEGRRGGIEGGGGVLCRLGAANRLVVSGLLVLA